jgi:hypothetical protein
VKAGGKLPETSNYIGNKREMEDSKPVPGGSPVGQDEPPVPTGSHTHSSESITSMALKRACSASLREDKGEVVRMWWVGNRGVCEISRVCGSYACGAGRRSRNHGGDSG